MASELHVVLGGTGAVGKAVVAALQARNLPVRSVSRHEPTEKILGVEWVRADVRFLGEVREALKGGSHVYICVALPYSRKVWDIDWPLLMQNVIDAAQHEKAKVVFLDNIYMYGTDPLQNPITEEHPLVPVSKKGKIRKHVADLLMYAHSTQAVKAVIGRAADFYGPGATNSLLYVSILQNMLANKPLLWLGEPARLHSFTYLKDAGDALVELALCDEAYGQVWHLPTREPPLTVQTLVDMMGRITNKPTKIRAVPNYAATLAGFFVPLIEEAAEMMYQSESDYVFSSRKFMTRFPDFHITPYEQGIDEMVRYFWVNAEH
jgi:nucleoside-diphosphate-sugar epimerase